MSPAILQPPPPFSRQPRVGSTISQLSTQAVTQQPAPELVEGTQVLQLRQHASKRQRLLAVAVLLLRVA
jgi:hypothetical protein